MAYLVAVTACVSGVAHTYMAAERLEKLCQLEKWGVSIETQGALGTENRLADEDIRRADVALLITDIELAGAERFEHCRYVGVVCGRGRNPTLRLWPAIFSGEIDVFPSERRNMGQEIGR
ncbi:PTS fructose-like transporter subunit IIB [Escherichia coli]|nr:PTS fructose-like transporter subunit IIB [Escherichia coli]EFM4146157.1 PTS fructose-like transporter subunit IIB [Escherichia coli]MHY67200.1 PTS fructose-like transporter subunit IIB [Escherichia coli]MHY67612.1 PTS fructose-like transporter subunit IIB [Escherichia coli]MIB05535.1 PTS fructose-like transporter subunit IIB [Escherichia coli]